MTKKHNISLFIFRRDLRLDDNIGLQAALDHSEQVIPMFIFDDRQVGEANPYRSINAMQFMIDSLKDLSHELTKKNAHLFIFYGKPEKIVSEVCKQQLVHAVFCNRDYTPFSIYRDQVIKSVCEDLKIPFYSCNDLLLTQPEEIRTSNKKSYSKFTAFYNNARFMPVAPAYHVRGTHFFTQKLPSACEADTLYKKIFSYPYNQLLITGGSSLGRTILSSLSRFKKYESEKDYPAVHGTTQLSAYLKFGCISIRQTYHAIKKYLGESHPLLRQLYWRDFFTHIGYNYPHVFGAPFHSKFDSLQWDSNTKSFNAWCQGNTGFPIVDAGMRQLNQTGFMHNRVRMITGSFLTKDIHIDWRWGERYFAQLLVDYDPAVNNGNWQWIASTGCDAQPYFRIFNPWLQQKKFDPQCIYIKQWIPELATMSSKVIHSWYLPTTDRTGIAYPPPIVDHTTESTFAKNRYRNSTKK